MKKEIISTGEIDTIEIIDNYEKELNMRIIRLIINFSLIIFSGSLVPLTFFTGYYSKFLLSIVSFSLITLFVIINSIEMILKHLKIKSLKNSINYKCMEDYNFKKINYRTLNKIQKLREL